VVEVGAHRRHKNQQQQLVNYWRIFICAITGDSLFPVYRLVIFFYGEDFKFKFKLCEIANARYHLYAGARSPCCGRVFVMSDVLVNVAGCRLALATSSCDGDCDETEEETHQGCEAETPTVSSQRASLQRSDVGRQPFGLFLHP